ncbi:uncharacterized protein BX664DRAFT_385889 [Halteromyces radiatus]|uniref:uncharacterized protein n=1 Tax=Halteromyces radiatus TaxID=101107 RepID=UPI00221FD375|nr:uncharacterized protein BX664DRAFT_385889 [Halteromyces radiatus]KAI8089395.1 hypothetical protein BX664DRAFT_385889 [Halteromyces radiatus]
MKRFGLVDTPRKQEKHLPPVDVKVNDAPVFFIGPASRENPMSQIRTKLMGHVSFHDPKIKWNRITLQFVGKAGLHMDVPTSTLPPKEFGSGLGEEAIVSNNAMTRLETTVKLCEVEKELIFISGEKTIEFGLHLPHHLPPSIKTDHAFVEYHLVAIFSAGSFFKKYRIQRTVTLCRHYLPSASALIPSIEYNGVREWFEWSAEVPKAMAIETGEVVLALRWSVEKERVEVDRIELSLHELENYRFNTKTGLHNLKPIITKFPVSVYHPPSFSNSSETHFIRTPLMSQVRTHHFDPFLEITHRLRMVIHFADQTTHAKPLTLEFPIIITDYPKDGSCPTNISPTSSTPITTNANNTPISSTSSTTTMMNNVVLPTGGDDAVAVDLDLPEYTPQYYEHELTLQ